MLTKLTIGRMNYRWDPTIPYSTATLEVSIAAFDLSGVDVQGLAGYALAGFLYRCL